jgi:hypothetical protein
MKEHFDEVWCVVANEQVRLERLMKRDNFTEEQARQMIALQMTQTEKASMSDYLIDNSGDIENTAAQVATLAVELLKRVEKYFAAEFARLAASQPANTGAGTGTTEPGDAGANPAEPGDSGANPGKSGDGDKPGGDDGNKVPDPGSEEANQRYRDFLRKGAATAADAVLDRLGNVASTSHQEGEAELTLTVGRKADGHADLGRVLKVKVFMEARNTPGAPPDPNGCSCGCGTKCRVSCACQPDCGCLCKKPTPPPPPPHGDGCGKRNRLWLGVLGLFGLLAFLFACLMLWHWHTHGHDIKGGGTQVTIINQPPDCSTCKPEPPTPPTPPVEPPNPPFEPPAPPPVIPPGGCSGEKQVFSEVPGLAFRFVHNAVRVNVAKWEVVFAESCRGATVTGFDADGRLLVYQEYDDASWMIFQWVVTYYPNGNIQVDRFEGRTNKFVGRSIYRYNQSGVVVRAEQFDEGRRLAHTANFVRHGGGVVGALLVEEFDPMTGRPVIKRVIEGRDSVDTYLASKFYVWRWFAQR